MLNDPLDSMFYLDATAMPIGEGKIIGKNLEEIKLYVNWFDLFDLRFEKHS